MLKVIVTGSAGHFGSFVTNSLLQKNTEVVGIDNLSYGGNSMLSFISHPYFKFKKFDLCDDLDPIMEKADYVIHFAALVGPVCENYPEKARMINYEATLKICEWVKKNNTRLIYLSTCSNYGIQKGLATETSELNPLGVYAETKVEAEKHILSNLHNFILLRIATLAGLSPRPRFDTMLNEWVSEGYYNGKIECYQPNANRPFTHLIDASQAIYTIINNWEKASSNCYNIVGFNSTKIELANRIKSFTGCEVIENKTLIDNRNYAVSSELIKKDFGFSPNYDADFCINEVLSAIKLGIVSPRPEHRNS